MTDDLETIRDLVRRSATAQQTGQGLFARLEAAVRKDQQARDAAPRPAGAVADDLEQARDRVRYTRVITPRDRADAAVDRLEEAVRASERVAVVKLLREHPWPRTTDLDTVDAVADLILGGLRV